MIKRLLIIDLIGWLFIAALIYFLPSCSPQKRLNRLIKNNPELAKTDTVYSTKIFTVPGYYLDTTFKSSNAVTGLNDIIENYKDYLDSISRVKLQTEIKTYIVDRKCLEDTFKITLDNNGFCKIWQTRGFFHYQLNQPKMKYSFSVPVSYPKFEVTTKNNWLLFWIGFAIVPFIISILVVILKLFK